MFGLDPTPLIEFYGRAQSSMSGSLKGFLLIGGFLFLMLAERLRPLRELRYPGLRRLFRNLTLGGVSSLLVTLTLLPMVFLVTRVTAAKEWGLMYWISLPKPVAVLLGLLLMDYTFYWWHYWNHHVPFFWRFHNVHHVDLDLDVSTAVRFHAGELLLSTFFRSAQIVTLGIDPFTWILFETLVVLSAQFHHSNWRLPIRLERWLNLLIVTPRMHGIHHSIVQRETNANFSTLFSFWDRIHGSHDFSVPQSQLTVGVPSYQNPEELRLWDIFLLPFRKQRRWVLADGQTPQRSAVPTPERTLADN